MERPPARRSRKPFVFLLSVIFLSALAAFSWLALKRGISLDRLEFASLMAEQVAIRLEDRFIITAGRVELRDTPLTETSYGPEKYIPFFNRWSHLFQKIHVQQIIHRDQLFTLLFEDNLFTVSDDIFQLAATIYYREGQLRLNIAELKLLPYQLSLAGTAVYDQQTERFDFAGNFSAFGVEGRAEVAKRGDNIDAVIRTDPFTDLAGILAGLSVDPEAVSWVDENISARDYLLNTLHLGFSIKDGKVAPRPHAIYGSATAIDAAVRFHPDLPPVRCGKVDVSYEDDRLSFHLGEPTYQNRSLAGSSVAIVPLLAENTRLEINIRTETRLDDTIHQILRSYDIPLQFSQQSGTTRADLNLTLDLDDFALSADGSFTADEGDWLWREIPLRTEGVAIGLQDRLVRIEHASLFYRDIMEAELVGSIDTVKNKAAVAAIIKKLDVRDNDRSILQASNLRAPADIQFMENELDIHFPAQRTRITFRPEQKRVFLDDLNKAKSFIPVLQDLPLQNGRLTIEITSRDDISFEGVVDSDILPLSADGKPVTRYAFRGSRTGEDLNVTANDGKILMHIGERVDVQLRDYLVTVDTEKLGKEKTTSFQVPLRITGPSSLIKLKNTSIPLDDFTAEVAGSSVTFTAELDHGNILFESNAEEKSLTATDIDALIAQDFFPFADLEGGRFNLSLRGTNEKKYEGYVEFSNVLIRDVALLNNVLSFINAIPALATFSSPGFDADGYLVNEGVAHFSRNGDMVTIKQLRTDGTTINTEAEGWIDLEQDSLEINVNLISLKDYSKIINMIPWVGYALLGEDGCLSTSLLLSGNLSSPEISTMLPEEIVLMPLNVVKRSIQWPLRVLGKAAADTASEPDGPDEPYELDGLDE